MSNWKGALTKFTETMRELLPIIADDLDVRVYNSDYYTLDAIFYHDKDDEHFPRTSVYAEYIAIAFEHENRVIGSEAEINKLQLFNAPLKVLVTYAGDQAKDYYLARYEKIIQQADIFRDIPTKKRQLVIFGTCDGNRTQWTFHVYTGNGFHELQ